MLAYLANNCFLSTCFSFSSDIVLPSHIGIPTQNLIMEGLESEKKIVRIGSRKSQLALVQTHTIIDMLQHQYPDM